MLSERAKKALLGAIFAWAALANGPLVAEEALIRHRLQGRLVDVEETLVEAIEREGLVVTAILPFGDMLRRTTALAGKGPLPYLEARILQFCHAGIAHQLVREQPEQIALCPLAISLYVPSESPGVVVLVYRHPGSGSQGRRRAAQLLERLMRAVDPEAVASG